MKPKRKAPQKTPKSELTKILLVFIENLIPFDSIQNAHLSNFLTSGRTNDKHASFPNPESLRKACHQLYLDYMAYFHHYFSSNSQFLHQRFNLSMHKWTPPSSRTPLLFMSLTYINKNYRLCDLPFSFIQLSHLDSSLMKEGNSALVPNGKSVDSQVAPPTSTSLALLKDLSPKLSFITTNFELESRTVDILRFCTNEEIDEKKILKCFPTFVNEVICQFLRDFQEVHDNGSNSYKTCNIQSSALHSREMIPLSIYDSVSRFMSKLSELGFPDNCDWFKMDRDECEFQSLVNILKYKQDILKNAKYLPNAVEVTISPDEWQIFEFLINISRRFHDIVSICLEVQHPTVHMVLKWIKILIVHTTAFEKNSSSSDYITISGKAKQPLRILLERLMKYHNEIETKFEIQIASYLHPSTKRYLKEADINRVNTFVGDVSNSKNRNGNASNHTYNAYADNGRTGGAGYDNLDDMIMKVFNCSGSGTKECYSYETSSSSEIKYPRSSKYVSLESGSYLLDFWNANQNKYPTLSSIARSVLSIQVCSDGRLEEFKEFYSRQNSRRSKSSLSENQEIRFLHHLSKVYDLNLFNPKNLDSDIEDYLLPRGEEKGEEFDVVDDDDDFEQRDEHHYEDAEEDSEECEDTESKRDVGAEYDTERSRVGLTQQDNVSSRKGSDSDTNFDKYKHVIGEDNTQLKRARERVVSPVMENDDEDNADQQDMDLDLSIGYISPASIDSSKRARKN